YQQSIESTQGTRRTLSAPKSPNPEMNEGESSGIDFKSHDELEAQQNVQKVKEHLIAKEIEKLVKEPRSEKESLEVEITAEVQPTNINEEEEESVEDDYDLKRREKGKHVEESKIYVAHGLILERQQSEADVAKMISDAIQQERENLRFDITSQINDAISNHIPLQVDSSVRNYMSGHILHVHPTQATSTSVQEQQKQLYLTMRDNLQLQQDDLPIWLALRYKFERLYVATTPCRPSIVRSRDREDPHDDAHLKEENSAKRQKTSKHGTFVFGKSSFGQVFECKQDDEIPNEKVSQLVDEMSDTVDEAKLRKVIDEMLR
nr:hypothetical protein [Tanacetum cinerariifolium]